MLLPKTPGGLAAAKTLQEHRERTAASSIQNSAKRELSSDEFLSKADIREQMQRLQEHCRSDPDRLPRPVGWRVSFLVLMPPEKTSGGLILTADTAEQYAHKSMQGVVLALGEAAYTDAERFPAGPWVKVGDRVVFKRYDAQIFELSNGQKIGIMNDTQPIAVIGRGVTIEGEDRHE